MQFPMRRTLSAAVLLTMAACSGIPTKTFVFDAIDTGEAPRPCMIVVNQDFQTATEKNQFVNVGSDNELPIEIQFPSGEVEITVVPLMVEGDRITRVPKSRKEGVDYSGFLDDTRKLRPSDTRRHLFILARRSG
jgi:hypothetical protein